MRLEKWGLTLLDFYNAAAQDRSIHETSLHSWYRLPLNERETKLVVSVKASDAALWVIAYTYLITLIFMAGCELAILTVLPFFSCGTSGNRHAILVAYYNAGRPSKMVLSMLGYLRNSLFRCRKVVGGHRIWAVDWSGASASFSLFLVAFCLISGNGIAGFFLGGKKLIVANVGQVNPAAVYYPDVDFVRDMSGQNSVPVSAFEAFKGIRSAAVHQAIARKTGATKNLASRINYTSELLRDGVKLDGGAIQNGTGARFTYGYNITGYEMGLRDAPGLVFAVKGRCDTYRGPDIVFFTHNYTYPNIFESVESYRFYGNRTWANIVILSRENYTAPWAHLLINSTDEGLHQNTVYGGFTFDLVPHTAWRPSWEEKFDDPWYETEVNPAYLDNPPEKGEEYNGPNNAKYRVKRARPSLRCTQNDTYSLNGATVNHVDKLDELPGLKLSPLVKKFIFGREFGTPVFSQLLGYVPMGSLASSIHFIPNQRRLDAPRASLFNDFQGLVNTSFVYSREVVRNAVLLFPNLEGRNDQVLRNAAANGSRSVPKSNADILVESQAVAALSVFVLVSTPVFCIFLWTIVIIWSTLYDPDSKLDNSSIRGRHGLRYYALQAVHLYRYLDEELSKKRKYSGRMTDTPFIRDLDVLEGEQEPFFPASAKAYEAAHVTEATTELMRSQFAEPKLVRLDGAAPEEPRFMDIVADWWRLTFLRRQLPPRDEYEVVMTQVWERDLPPVPRRYIRENL